MVKPNETLTLSFLQSIGHDIHLCSIVPDGGRCTGKWFGDDATAATEWALRATEKGHNVYWTVNLVSEGCNKKPSKEDILAARFLHVDIDPPKGGGSFDKLMTQATLVALSVPPSLIIDSGNGLQAFWRLANTYSLVEIEELNRALADKLGGDHCYNIDRLMRLPGTLNYPSLKKSAEGRTIALAKVIYDADIVLD